MLGLRTPNKPKAAEDSTGAKEACPAPAGPSVRPNIGEGEAEKQKSGQTQRAKTPVLSPPKKTTETSPPKSKPKLLATQRLRSETYEMPGKALERLENSHP